MDSCVLVPRDFSLVLTLHPDPRNILEMCVAVWSNSYLKLGQSFYPEDGEIKYEKLEIFSTLKSDNIRRKFGCYDEVLMVDEREVRHCNWIRFVKSSNKLEEVNMVGIKIKEEIVFQLVKDVRPNDELVVYFQHLPEVAIKPEPEVVQHQFEQDVYIDKENISPDSMETSSIISSPSPVSRDDGISLVTDIASGSEDSGHHSDMNLSKTPSPTPYTRTHPDHNIMLPVKRARERTWLPCEICQKKFDRPSLLKRHMRTHTGEKPHACDVCGKAFSTSSSLNTHRRIHSGEKPHQCSVCGKKFTASSNLYYHRMTHKKEKPHKCTMCTKSFPTPGDLKSHMYIHNGSWPFKCDICNRGFSKQTNLKNHMLLHSGDKPHQCTVCEKRFALQCNLKTHMKTHEDEANQACTRCNKMAATSDGLCVKCCDDVRIMPEDRDRKSPSDFSIAKLTENPSKRQRLDSESIYSNGSPFHPSATSQFPYFCSTPIDKKSVNYTSFPRIPSTSSELYSSVDRQFYPTGMVPRNHPFNYGPVPSLAGSWTSPMMQRF